METETRDVWRVETPEGKGPYFVGMYDTVHGNGATDCFSSLFATPYALRTMVSNITMRFIAPPAKLRSCRRNRIE